MLNHEYYVVLGRDEIVFSADELEPCLEYVNEKRGTSREIEYNYSWNHIRNMNEYQTRAVFERWNERSRYRPLYDCYSIVHIVTNEYYQKIS